MSGTKADCYRLIQEVTVARDVFCQKPGCGKKSDCGHHVFGRKNLSTAFLPEAVIGVCTEHHTGWAHNMPREFKKFMVGRIGEERYYGLRRLSNEVAKNLDYSAISDSLKSLLVEIKKISR